MTPAPQAKRLEPERLAAAGAQKEQVRELVERITPQPDCPIALLRAHLAPQPMESAPRDGTRVLLYMQFDHRRVGGTPGEITPCCGYWTDLNGGGWVRPLGGEPTAWLPLPPAPKTQET